MPKNALLSPTAANEFRLMSLKRMVNDTAFRQCLDKIATEISNDAKSAANEATVVSNFERVLYGFMKSAVGFDFVTEREIGVTILEDGRRVVKGRIDSRIGALVIEYKHRSALSTDTQRAKVLKQISEQPRVL